jgi:hypothetical protein
MKQYVLFMHNDAPDGGLPRPRAEWSEYFERLNAEHLFEGGSSVGGGFCMNLDGSSPDISSRIFGFIRLRVRDLEHAQELVRLNPVYRAGGTVEIRELED